jgi:hypothetical protein
MSTPRSTELNNFDFQLLSGLTTQERTPASRTEGGWFTPLDLGGANRSPHSRRLKRLALLEHVLSRQRSTGASRPQHGVRGSREYKITLKGINALNHHQNPCEE